MWEEKLVFTETKLNALERFDKVITLLIRCKGVEGKL